MVKRGWTSSLLVCAGLVAWPALLGAQGLFVSFDGGIGVLPSATTNPNVVRGINPAGQVWVIDELRAECPSPVLLVRNVSGAWFAAGIPKRF